MSFARIGVYTLIRYILHPGHRMTREGIHAALRSRTPFAVDLVEDVIDRMFEEDIDGTIYSPGIDRAVSDSVEP